MKTKEQIEEYLKSLNDSKNSAEYTLEYADLDDNTYNELFNTIEVITGKIKSLKWALED